MSTGNFSKWRSGLSAESRAEVDERKAEVTRAISLFRQIRENLRLTQVEAASRLESTQANVSKIEKRSATDLNQIRKLVGDDYEVALVLRKKGEQEERKFAIM